MIKIPREQTEFVTPLGLLCYLHLYPGQAQDSFGNKAYKVEWVGDLTPDHQMVKAACIVAQTYDPNNWQRHIFGPGGRLQKQEEKPKRKPANYAVGKYVIDFSKVCSLKSLRLDEKLDMTNPEQRVMYDKALNAAAPLAHRFANPSLPADVDRIHQINAERLAQGLPVHQESAYSKVMLPVAPHDIWAGCYGHIAGYFYWNTNGKPPTLGIGLTRVLLVRQGERLVADDSPDRAFEGFAPTADLAPQAPQPPVNPFASIF